MSNLSSAAETRFRRIASQAPTPSWWNLGQVVLGVMFFMYLGYSLLSPSTPVEVEPAAAPTSEEADPAEVIDVVPSPPGGTAAPTIPPDTAVPVPTDPPSTTPETPAVGFTGAAAEPVSVAFSSGGTTQVPAGMLVLARSSAAALAGADRAGVPTAPGAAWPAPASTWPDAVGSDVLLVSLDTDAATFRVLVTRSSAPQAAGAWTTVQLRASEGQWVLDPEAG